MADDKKSDSAPPPEIIDDWDSLPLDPDGDDWDDLPAPKASPAPPPGPESTSPPVMAAPIPPAADPPSASKLPPGAAPPPDSGQIFALLGADDEFNVEDFGDQPLDEDSDLDDSALPPADEMDEFDLPSPTGPAPDGGSTETPDEELDFDLILSAAQAAEADPEDDGQGEADQGGPAEIDDFDAPGENEAEAEADAAASPSPVEAGSADFPADPVEMEPATAAEDDASGQDDSDPPAATAPGGDAEAAEEPPDEQASGSMMEKIEAELDDLPTKKVELDIEGIFLEDHDPLPTEGGDDPPPEPEPQAEAAPPAEAPAAPEEAPAPKKIPKLKLLMVLAPVLLLVGGLGFGAYKLFFAAPPAEEGPPPLVIDPAVPAREARPGSLDLGSFFVNFPGERSETIIEMTVVLHYKDLPNRAAIEARLPLVRDIIYLVAQGQGSQVISNGEAQRQLRQIAAQEANTALGGEHIDYVQISQIRILQ